MCWISILLLCSIAHIAHHPAPTIMYSDQVSNTQNAIIFDVILYEEHCLACVCFQRKMSCRNGFVRYSIIMHEQHEWQRQHGAENRNGKINTIFLTFHTSMEWAEGRWTSIELESILWHELGRSEPLQRFSNCRITPLDFAFDIFYPFEKMAFYSDIVSLTACTMNWFIDISMKTFFLSPSSPSRAFIRMELL